jgi:5-methylthioribose kinase
MNWPAGVYFLDQSNVAALQEYLRATGFIGNGDRVTAVAKAGEGNMNCTLRVQTTRGTFIMKQSRPWVEKYPHIAAPWDRALAEARFYEFVATCPEIAACMPRVLNVDPAARLLCIEDFGAAEDLTSMYAGRRLEQEVVQTLAAFLAALHRSFRGHPRAHELENREMRLLNHQHIFVLPLAALQPDPLYAAKIASLGEEYLRSGDFLLHGDFFPGSWLQTERGIKIIDPEFSFFGPPEFDLGVFVAHLHLARSGDVVEAVFDAYNSLPVCRARVLQFAGVEIMRRLVGVAKLPVSFTGEEQRDLLALARKVVVQ